MYLIDTNVISEARKGPAAQAGVIEFFRRCLEQGALIYLSAVTVGELRRGVDLIRHRGDTPQADRLETWLQQVVEEYQECILPFDLEIAQIWGRLRAPNPQNALDKQIAATALLYDLTLVTRNTADVAGTGVRYLDPFAVGN